MALQQLIEFEGTFPYASELFGIYQPLLGWEGRQAARRVDQVRRQNVVAVATQVYDNPNLWAGKDQPTIAYPLTSPGSPPVGLSSVVGVKVAAQAHSIELAAGRQISDAELKSLLTVEKLTKVLDAVVNDPATAARIIAVQESLRGSTNTQPAGFAATFDPRRFVLGHEAAMASTLAWLGSSSPAAARALLLSRSDTFALAQYYVDPIVAYVSGDVTLVLSPVGLVQLYREYFFELDTFLGPPVGHTWVSPGGTLELVEVNTRKVTVEQTTEFTTASMRQQEATTTQQDDLADAVKEQNGQNTKLGAVASASFSLGKVFQAQASGSFGLDTTRSTSDEIAHKQMRSQSEKLTEEIRQNFKTTFRTVTETTDTSSRRYVLSNTTTNLVNYELRRKMRRVAVQVQHIGTQLCWQVYLDNPGDSLGIAELVHVAKPSDTGSSPAPPDAPAVLEAKDSVFEIDFAFQPIGDPGATDDDYFNGSEDPTVGKTKYIVWKADYTPPSPAAGYSLSTVTLEGVHGQGGSAAARPTFTPNQPTANAFHMELPYVNFGDGNSIHITVALHWSPPDNSAAVNQYKSKFADYTDSVRRATQAAYVDLVRDRIEKTGSVKLRSANDLREEERSIVYQMLLSQLQYGTAPSKLHVVAELVRAMFDVDSMLYFVAEDWWRPRLWFSQQVDQPYTASLPSAGGSQTQWYTLRSDEEVGWGGVGDPWRPNYKITENSTPAPMGASLGWLLQLDGDALRNAFLNAPWIKAIIPIRLGKETDALAWLQFEQVEGVNGLDDPYVAAPNDPPELQDVTVREALDILAKEVGTQGTDMTHVLEAETVFENGFDPLDGGFRASTAPFQIFDQWIEILPTDQVVAVNYTPPA